MLDAFKLHAPELKVNKELIKGREMQKLIYEKITKHQYQSMEMEVLRKVLITEMEYNKELWEELKAIREVGDAGDY